MRLETLLPRPLDPCGGSECATLMGALIAAIHLDRRRARALGWRGVRPSGSLLPAWTCRVAGSGLVFGLVFFGEDADGGALRGTFAAYAFPLPDDPLLEVFPLEALRLAVDPGYGDRIRALSEHAETLSPFRIGTVSLRAAVDGSGLSLTLSAPARLRMAALDGVATSPGGQRWLVEPGGWETDVPAFRLLLRPFAALSATAESLLGDPARVSLDGEAAPIPGFDAAGNIRHIPGGTGRELRLTAAFGSAGAKGVPSPVCPCATSRLRRNPACPCCTSSPAFSARAKPHSCGNGWISCTGVSAIRASSKMNSEKSALTRRSARRNPGWRRLMRGALCCSLGGQPASGAAAAHRGHARRAVHIGNYGAGEPRQRHGRAVRAARHRAARPCDHGGGRP